MDQHAVQHEGSTWSIVGVLKQASSWGWCGYHRMLSTRIIKAHFHSPLPSKTMSTSEFSIFSSIFGFVAAAITLFTLVVTTCRSQLPSEKIKELESLMDETEARFKKAFEDGLLELEIVSQIECHLTR
ncbi:hypothetical protein J3R82DRAFT_6389 [Butyriboletus roseoflavus]|nr:hypothetical protein J3R82DRAFT_6389 [Butyriboletus roseoflavus]